MGFINIIKTMCSRTTSAELEAKAQAAGLPSLLTLLRDHLPLEIKTDLCNREYDLMHRQDWHFLAGLFYLPGHDQDFSLKVRVLQYVAINYAHQL